MNRRKARETVMKCIFQMEAQRDFTPDNAAGLLREVNTGSQEQYIDELLTRFCDNLPDVDAALNDNSASWPTSRMAKHDLAILRLAATEILYIPQIPKSVSINEAVELAKTYGSDKSPGFVNAVLRGVGGQEA